MIDKIYSFYYHYLKGVKIIRPIVVIESDDWGSIRIPNKNVHQSLQECNIDVVSNPFNRLDTLESEEDLENIHKTLKRIYHDTGKKVVITANTVLTNPDFVKIRDNHFTEYYKQDFRDSYLIYGYLNAWEKFQSLINDDYFKPQFHAREHLQVQRWLDFLRSGEPQFIKAFENQVFSIDFKNHEGCTENLMASYHYKDSSHKVFIENSISEGLSLFKDIFGFHSKTTIPPVGIWYDNLENIFSEKGVNTIQCFIIQKIPYGNILKKQYRYIGETTSSGLKYCPRNVYFEPSTDQNYNWVKKSLDKVAMAFYFKKPAIISTHRINFVGGIAPENRLVSMRKFDLLIRKIIKKWPEVQFISSDKLCEYL